MTGEGRLLRALLILAANTVHPSPDGLARIQARTRKTAGVPGVASPGRREAAPSREDRP